MVTRSVCGSSLFVCTPLSMIFTVLKLDTSVSQNKSIPFPVLVYKRKMQQIGYPTPYFYLSIFEAVYVYPPPPGYIQAPERVFPSSLNLALQYAGDPFSPNQIVS